MLSDGGILAFVLPSSFLNCLYYEKLRRHIVNNFTIINIVDCNECKYIDTQQDTIIFVVKNSKFAASKFYTLINDNTH